MVTYVGKYELEISSTSDKSIKGAHLKWIGIYELVINKDTSMNRANSYF